MPPFAAARASFTLARERVGIWIGLPNSGTSAAREVARTEFARLSIALSMGPSIDPEQTLVPRFFETLETSPGATARESYDRMIDMVSRAERWLARSAAKRIVSARLPRKLSRAVDIAPLLRGLLAIPEDRNEGRFQRFVLDRRVNEKVLAFVNGRDIARYSQIGTVTPRTSSTPRPHKKPAMSSSLMPGGSGAVAAYGNSGAPPSTIATGIGFPARFQERQWAAPS